MSVGGSEGSGRVPPARPAARMPSAWVQPPAGRPPVRMPPTKPERWVPEELERWRSDGPEWPLDTPERPAAPVRTGVPDRATPPDARERPSPKWLAVLTGLILVFGVLAAYDLLSDRGALTAKPVAAASPSASRAHTVPARSAPTTSAKATTRARPSASALGSPSPSGSPSVRVLSAVSATAFGPDGTSDGDNSGLAANVLAGNGVSGWTSNWYATPDFGELQAGTGLLLDMGTTVSVSRVRVVLGDSVGADVQLRLGDSDDGPGGLSTAASAADVGGTVHLSLSSPVRARYVLIWFTRLPPNDQGKYQVTVYSIRVSGHR